MLLKDSALDRKVEIAGNERFGGFGRDPAADSGGADVPDLDVEGKAAGFTAVPKRREPFAGGFEMQGREVDDVARGRSRKRTALPVPPCSPVLTRSRTVTEAIWKRLARQIPPWTSRFHSGGQYSGFMRRGWHS